MDANSVRMVDKSADALLAEGVSKEERYDWNTRTGGRGRFRNIKKTDLLVDMDYQREQSTNKIRQIARNFDWAAFGCLIVSERKNGAYYVIEGQGRTLAACLRSDVSSVPCLIFSGLSKADEARVFVLINKHRRPPRGTEVFAAQVVAKDEKALSIEATLEKHGVRVSAGSNHPDEVRCVQALYAMNGTLDDVLTFVNEAWPGDMLRLNRTPLVGVEKFIGMLRTQTGKDQDAKSIADGFRSVPLAMLIQQAKTTVKMEGRSMREAFADAMVVAYNKGRRTGRLSATGRK